MKMPLDKMALMNLIILIFGSRGIFFSESAGVFVFLFGCIVKKLLAKNVGTLRRLLF